MRTTDGESSPETRLGRLTAGLAELAASDPAEWSDAAVRSGLAELLIAVNQLAAVTASVLGAFDARTLSEVDALRTSRTWLTAFGRMSQGAASSWLSRARLSRELPILAQRSIRGEVSAEAVRIIADLVDRLGIAAVREFDAILAEVAAAAGPAQLRTACERIVAHVDPDGPDGRPDAGWHQRALTVSRSGSVMLLRGQLDLAGGSALLTALDAVMTPPGPDDLRTPAQRRADALAELAYRSLQSGDLPTVQGARPQLGVLITPSTLLSRPGTDQRHEILRLFANRDPNPAGPCRAGPPSAASATATRSDPESVPSPKSKPEPESGREPESEPGPVSGRGAVSEGGAVPGPVAPPEVGTAGSRWDPLSEAGLAALPERAWLTWAGEVPAAVAQRIACDCEVWRAVLDPLTGLPLEVGRNHRIVPHWIRKALHARDRGCRWPGCTTPAAWTDSHHLFAWYHGGKTNVDNLVSLCRYHHGIVHEGQWAVQLDLTTGDINVTRPDGRPYELGASRAWISPTRQTGDPHSPAMPEAA